ncbi:SUMO1 sentrin specific peptidase 1 [Globomyces sp. JEL0801]|nr:SUMO1 sentrin specific peptidase 1 [Globomyces sp. JEL0801]
MLKRKPQDPVSSPPKKQAIDSGNREKQEPVAVLVELPWYSRIMPWNWTFDFTNKTNPKKMEAKDDSVSESSDKVEHDSAHHLSASITHEREDTKLIEGTSTLNKTTNDHEDSAQHNLKLESLDVDLNNPLEALDEPKAESLKTDLVQTIPPLFQNIKIGSTNENTPIASKQRRNLQRDSLLKKSSGISSIRKQQSKIRQGALENVKKQFLIGYDSATVSGFLGTESDFAEVADYMQRVEEIASKMNKRPSSPNVNKRNTVSQYSTPIKKGTLKDLPETPTIEIKWIKDLRDSIQRRLKHTPSEYQRLFSPESKNLQRLQAKEEEIDRQVEESQQGEGEAVYGFSVSIQKHDMRTLAGRAWLNDEVINFYAELCMQRAKENPTLYPKIHVFNTFFYEKLRTNGYKAVRRWSKKFDIFEKDYIIIPVHLQMHWCCAVINFKKNRFEYYDSLHGNNPLCLKLLREYVEAESLDKKKIPFDTSKWVDYTPKNIPEQQNGYDCGVFACMFMEFTAREENFAFRQSHMDYLRKRIALEILNKKLMGKKK